MQEEQQQQEASPAKQEINFITLIKQPEEFKSTFKHLWRAAAEAFHKQQFQEAINLFVKCVDMLDIGKNVLVGLSIFTKPCLFASLAAAYQYALKMQKCSKFCEKAQEQLMKLMDSKNKEMVLKVNKQIIKLKFQHCAILSQLNQHQKALQVCKSTISYLEECIEIVYAYAKKQEESLNMKSNEDGVIFSKRVYALALEILHHLNHQIIQSPSPQNTKSSSLYFWERNPQKNEEQLKKIFIPQSNEHSKRSILGVNKQNHWVDEFNIGSIMRMTEVKTDQLEKIIPMEEYLFKDKLYQLVIFTSLSFFTIATEIRFLDAEKLEDQPTHNDQNKLDLIKKKYGYQEKSTLFRQSEAYHLKAIEVISKNIQSSIPYLTHIIKSYDKHYIFKKKLEEIVAMADQSQLDHSSILQLDRNQNLRQKSISKEMHFQSSVYGERSKNSEEQPSSKNSEKAEIKKQDNIFEDYSNFDQSKESKNKRSQKDVRNTMKLFYSQPHEQAKNRAKSVGKMRKNIKPAVKEQKISQPILNKPKKKQKAEEKHKKTRIKFNELEGEGELHVKTKSSTHIKFVFKKKK